MATSPLLISLLAVVVFASGPIYVAHGCGISIVNKCGYAVTTCAQSESNAISQYLIGANGGSQYLNFGTACKWPSAAIWASVTGKCANPAGSGAATDRNLANLAEFNIGQSSLDYYDLSNVEAYTIGLGISVTSSKGGQCSTIKCSIPNIRSFCGGDNQLITESSGALVCKNTDGAAGEGPTANTKLFKNACPQAYSYNYDDATSTFTCNTGSNYQVTFCP